MKRAALLMLTWKKELKPMRLWKLYWSPSGQHIATVKAKDARSAIRKAPAPWSLYVGEIYAEEAK